MKLNKAIHRILAHLLKKVIKANFPLPFLMNNLILGYILICMTIKSCFCWCSWFITPCVVLFSGLAAEPTHLHHQGHTQLAQDPLTGHTLVISTMPVTHAPLIGGLWDVCVYVCACNRTLLFDDSAKSLSPLPSPCSLARHSNPIAPSGSGAREVQTLRPTSLSSGQPLVVHAGRSLTPVCREDVFISFP